MEKENKTLLKEFILVGFPQNIYVCLLLFSEFFLMYILTVFGNVLVIMAIILSPKLHQPMYFFLCNLSFLDLSLSSNNVPKEMVDVFSRKRTISVLGCMVQMNTNLFIGGMESFLLAVMAYDRYMAICFPLHYTNIMNLKTCINIIVIMWLGSFLILTVLANLRPMLFCTENRLDHFVCEILAMLPLMCGNISFLRVTLFVVSCITLLVPLAFILVSYALIISTILKIKSTSGRSKAFSTCSSHLTVVLMFYGTTISMYIGQTESVSSNLKYYSLVYGNVTPALNPLIYTLRNNNVKIECWKLLTKCGLGLSNYLIFTKHINI